MSAVEATKGPTHIALTENVRRRVWAECFAFNLPALVHPAKHWRMWSHDFREVDVNVLPP